MSKTNKSEYKKHRWSGGKRKRRKIEAGLKRYYGTTSRTEAWRKVQVKKPHAKGLLNTCSSSAEKRAAERCNQPRSLAVLCERVIKQYKLIPEKKKFTTPETFFVVGGKPLRKRPERPRYNPVKEKKANKGKNPQSLAVLCKIVIQEYNLLPQCEETERPYSNELTTKQRKRGRPSGPSKREKKIKPSGKPRGRPRKDQALSNEFGVASTSYSTYLEQYIRKIKVEQEPFLEQPPDEDPLRQDEDDFTVVIKEENVDDEAEEFIRHVPDTIEVPQATAQGIVINPMAGLEIPGPCGSAPLKTVTVVMDEYQMFANSIAEQLRALPPKRALLLQFDIQSMIDNEKQLIGHES